MYLPNDDKQYYSFCIFQLLVETFGHSTKRTNQSKFSKRFLSQRIRKSSEYFQTLGTSVINSPMFPPHLVHPCIISRSECTHGQYRTGQDTQKRLNWMTVTSILYKKVALFKLRLKKSYLMAGPFSLFMTRVYLRWEGGD